MRRKVTPFLSLPVLLAFAACSQAVTPTTPPATLAPLRVARITELAPLLPALQACSRRLPGVALLVDEIPGDALTLEEMQRSGVQMAFFLGEPGGELVGKGSLFPLGTETIDIVVNAHNPLKSLRADQLAGIFSGENRDWGEVGGAPGEIQVWTLPSGSPLNALLALALKVELPAASGAWFAQAPAWSLQAPAWLAPSPEDMLRQVAANPGAIGYLPHAWSAQAQQGSLKALTLPASLAGDLSLPVLALAAGEPQGAARELLACLQSGAGQPLLRGTYQPWQASTP